MNKLCRSKEGPAKCSDPRCPERVYYTKICKTLTNPRTSTRKALKLIEIKKQLETRNPELNHQTSDPAPEQHHETPPITPETSLDSRFKTDSEGRTFTTYNSPQIGQTDFYYGDLTSKEHLTALENADPKKEYQLGECAVLAGELWHRSPHVDDMFFLKTDDDPDYGLHVFVKLKDGSYADSLGVWSETELVSRWKTVDSSVELTLFDADIPAEGELERDENFKVTNEKLYKAVEKTINSRFETS